MKNQIEATFPAIAENESLARMIIGAFLLAEDPVLSIVSEVRTAVSEAVTNAVVHAYTEGENEGYVVLRAKVENNRLDVEIEDFGCGIADVSQAMMPFYTSNPDMERSGMGFSLMQSFMDKVFVESVPRRGTCVKMVKFLGNDYEV